MSSKAISDGWCGLLPVEMRINLAAQPAYAIHAGNGHGVGVFKRSAAADKFDVMKSEILQDPLAFHFNHVSLVVHEIVDGKILFQGIVDAVETALL